MKKLGILLTISLLLIITGYFRFFPKNLTDNAHENIEDVSIRLIYRHTTDTLVKTNYERTYNLSGNVCPKIETTSDFNSSKNLGVAIRFWTRIVMNEEGTFYGPFPKNGLLNKVELVNVSLSDDKNSVDISNWLEGDSLIENFIWKEYDSKKISKQWIMYKGCLRSPYFENTSDWITTLNNKMDTLEWANHYDYLFWFNTDDFKKINFSPNELKIKLITVDSNGVRNQPLLDSIKIKTL